MNYILRYRLKILCLIAPFLCAAPAASANEPSVLRVGYGSYQSAPYAVLKNEQLVGGLMYQIGIALGRRLEKKISFVNIPRKRLTQFLQSGRAHIRCHLSPKWLKNTTDIMWTSTLYKSHTAIAMDRAVAPSIQQVDDLKGLTIGTILGYNYSTEITNMFNDGSLKRMDSVALTNNLQMMNTNRIDAIIGTELILKHEIKKNGFDREFALTPLLLRTQEMKCAVSSHGT